MIKNAKGYSLIELIIALLITVISMTVIGVYQKITYDQIASINYASDLIDLELGIRSSLLSEKSCKCNFKDLTSSKIKNLPLSLKNYYTTFCESESNPLAAENFIPGTNNKIYLKKQQLNNTTVSSNNFTMLDLQLTIAKNADDSDEKTIYFPIGFTFSSDGTLDSCSLLPKKPMQEVVKTLKKSTSDYAKKYFTDTANPEKACGQYDNDELKDYMDNSTEPINPPIIFGPLNGKIKDVYSPFSQYQAEKEKYPYNGCTTSGDIKSCKSGALFISDGVDGIDTVKNPSPDMNVYAMELVNEYDYNTETKEYSNRVKGFRNLNGGPTFKGKYPPRLQPGQPRRKVPDVSFSAKDFADNKLADGTIIGNKKCINGIWRTINAPAE